MEARSFFESTPMREIVVSATEKEWKEVLLDLDVLRRTFDEEGVDLETSTTNLIHFLAKVKVFI